MTAKEHTFESTTLDTTTLETWGDEPRVVTKNDTEILYTFTTSSIVSNDEKNTSEGSKTGVDEHTAKLPNTGTPKVITVNPSINCVPPKSKHVNSEASEEEEALLNRVIDSDRKPTVMAKKSAEENTDNLVPNADASRNSPNTSCISPHNKSKVSID